MEFLWEGFLAITWKQAVMFLIGGVLIYLAIRKDYEPALLLPMGFGAILVNMPHSSVINHVVEGAGEVNGVIEWMFNVGIDAAEAMPILLFIGVGAMIDFGPLLAKPTLFLFGAAAHLGIFATLCISILAGFSLKDAAAIGIIGAADGPTVILFSQILQTKYLGAITVAAYSYMALVPIIQPAAIRLVTTKKERSIRMEYKPGEVSQTARILFPILITLVTGFTAPEAAALVGFLMFGNLIRECGVLHTTMQAEAFVRTETLLIMLLGLCAFIIDTMGGVLFAKFLNLFLKHKINPMVGGAGISAFPMSSRVVQKMALKEDPQNFILMQAAGANVSGQVASVVAGGVLIQLLAPYI